MTPEQARRSASISIGNFDNRSRSVARCARRRVAAAVRPRSLVRHAAAAESARLLRRRDRDHRARRRRRHGDFQRRLRRRAEAAAVPRTGSAGEHLQHFREHRLCTHVGQRRGSSRLAGGESRPSKTSRSIATWPTSTSPAPASRSGCSARASRRICCRSSAFRQCWAAALPRTKTRAATDTVVLLSDGLWRRRFGADPSIVGKTITLNGAPYTVVGVMGPDFQYPAREFQVWTPLTHQSGGADAGSFAATTILPSLD